MRVYLITETDYDHKYIWAVYSNREAAEAALAIKPNVYEIEEHELQDELHVYRFHHVYVFSADNIEWMTGSEVLEPQETTVSYRRTLGSAAGQESLAVYLMGTDKADIIAKIAEAVQVVDQGKDDGVSSLR